jgi:ABC-type multidrug transport system ATPase subunit
MTFRTEPKTMLRINNLCYEIREKQSRSRYLLQNISLSALPGQTIGIMGQNGSGKSTLLKILATLVQPTTGAFFWNEINAQVSLKAFRARLSYTECGPLGFYPRLTGLENLLLFLSLAAVRKSAKECVLEAASLGLSIEQLDQKCSTYSLGMMQMLHLTLMFLKDKSVSLVDEPTNGLSPESTKCLVYRLNQSHNSYRIIVSHDTHFLKLVSNRVFELKAGSLYELQSRTYDNLQK